MGDSVLASVAAGVTAIVTWRLLRGPSYEGKRRSKIQREYRATVRIHRERQKYELRRLRKDPAFKRRPGRQRKEKMRDLRGRQKEELAAVRKEAQELAEYRRRTDYWPPGRGGMTWDYD